MPEGASCTPSAPCSAPVVGLPSQSDELLVDQLVAGEDYTLTLRAHASLGHTSYPSPLVINQPTLPDVVTVSRVETYGENDITYYVEFESGVGSTVEFANEGETSGRPRSEERSFT